ncbi:hypothetical protein [Fusibacter sp. JL216-2]|uniref:hypothetical protein n=1 Tax=Fusibacter sp. JL216-2 TaxID=3071453 RepID=UPI003D326C58
MKSQSVFVTLIWLIILTLTLQGAGFADNIPDELGQVEAELDVNTPMFWIWNEDLELLQGSADPDTEMIYLASLTKAYTLNAFMKNFKSEITISVDTPYNYSKVKIGDTISYVDAITALLVRSCNTVAENMLDEPPKEGFVSSSGLPVEIDGVRYENMDTPTNVLNAFVENENLIEIYERIYDGRFGHTTYRKWTVYEDLNFCFIKTGFTNQAGRCVFIKTNHHYFLFVGWKKHSDLVRDSISMVRMYEKDHDPCDLKSLGKAYIKEAPSQE